MTAEPNAVVQAATSTRANRARLALERRVHDRAIQKTTLNVAALGGLCLFAAMESDAFLTWYNIENILNQIAVVVIIGSAFTLLMVAGAFDLSIGGVAALSGTVSALVALHGASPTVAFVIGTAVGLGVGIFNSILVVVFGITSFIATIGTMYMCRGIANIVSGGFEVSGLEDEYQNLGNGSWFGISLPVIIMVMFVVAFTAIQRWTLLGRHAVAAGSNPEASFLAGVPVRRTQAICFALTGAAAGWAGVIVSSRFNAGLPNSSVGLEFEVIVAAVVGGASLFGGEGRVPGTLLGALIIGVLSNGLDLGGVTSYWQTVTLGIVLIVAVGLDIVFRRDEFAKVVRRLRGGARPGREYA